MKTVVSAVMVALSLSAGMATAQATSDVSRAQVLNELHQARAQGLISDGELGYPVQTAPASQKTRSQVLAELDVAFQKGEINEYGMNFTPRKATSTKSRSQVVSDLHQYQATHEDAFIEH